MAELPKAVREAAERAKKLAEDLAKSENPEVNEEEEVVVENDETELDDDLALEQDDDNEESELDDDDELSVESFKEDNEEETVKREDTVEYWKQRFSILQGKYNNEVPVLHQKIRELEAKVEVSEKLDVSPEKSEEIANLKVEDFEDYGEEFITLVKAVNALEKRNSQLEKLAQGMTAQTTEVNQSTFTARLTEKVPDWETINTNNDFITWLQAPDGYSGRTKHESLLNAYNKFDANTVAKIFKEFKAEFSIPDKKKKKPKHGLEAEVSPSIGKQPERQPKRKVKGREYTRAYIAQFYKDKAMGKIDPKKAAAIEKDIFLANQDGRIVG